MTEQQHQSTYSGGSSTQAQPQLSPVCPRSLTAHGLKLPRNLQTSVAHMVRFSCSAREHVPFPTYVVRPRVAPVCPTPLRSRRVRSHCLPVCCLQLPRGFRTEALHRIVACHRGFSLLEIGIVTSWRPLLVVPRLFWLSGVVVVALLSRILLPDRLIQWRLAFQPTKRWQVFV